MKNLHLRVKHHVILSSLTLGLIVLIASGIGIGSGTYVADMLLKDSNAAKDVKGSEVPPQYIKPATQRTHEIVYAPDAAIPAIKNGLVPIISHLETKQPVVFLTIDDGAEKGGDFAAYLKERHIKATLFLADTFISSDFEYFKQFVANGSMIENHSISHNLKFNTTTEAYQQQEICGMSVKEHTYYGQRPYLFRAPGGEQTETTQRAAAACGIRAIIFWKAKANGGSMQYQEGDSLKAGDIVLMHFRPAFKADVDAFMKAADAAKLHPVLLEDWIPRNS